jgi:hypothetical protein
MRTARRLKIRVRDHFGKPYVGPVVVWLDDAEPVTVFTDSTGLLKAPALGTTATLEIPGKFFSLGNEYPAASHEPYEGEIEEVPEPPTSAGSSLEDLDDLVSFLDTVTFEEFAGQEVNGVS